MKTKCVKSFAQGQSQCISDGFLYLKPNISKLKRGALFFFTAFHFEVKTETPGVLCYNGNTNIC